MPPRRAGASREGFHLATPLMDQRAERVSARPERQLCVQHHARQERLRKSRRARRELQHQRVAAAAQPAQPRSLYAKAVVVLDDLAGDRPLVADALAGRDDLVALERPADRRADVGRQRAVERVQPPRRLSEQRQAPEPLGKAVAPVGARARKRTEPPNPRGEAGRLRVDQARRLSVPRGVSRRDGSEARANEIAQPQIERLDAGDHARRAASRRAAPAVSGSGGAASAAFSARCFFRSADSARLPSHSVTHSGGVAAGTRSGDSAARNSSPSACLHGNFRLGHEHFAARSSSATRTW